MPAPVPVCPPGAAAGASGATARHAIAARHQALARAEAGSCTSPEDAAARDPGNGDTDAEL